jgi:hypothetical protein
MVQPMEEVTLPKMTKDQFEQWKAAQEGERKAAEAAQIAQRRADLAEGRIPLDEMTGRELAEYHPEVFQGY